MAVKEPDKTRIVSFRFTPEEIQRIDNEWKGKGMFYTRTQFVKAAINQFTGDVILR
ncbi:MAG TPA: hypothetical protein O0X25_01710 [Methanocorpusculum sp.]|nr:hypothetical protein [Methanocorpusculum sp.]HJJ39713.1 hypothetical protein [Methanocorpusculum sp.]HJJ49322.1 hypothetical protein [Methanocorpusculum sp.]HJJ56634.1 hypothetical protein [Methanocorpusculum sp.]